jgi:formate dehydrogenase major subunit
MQADVVVVIGANPTDGHPVFASRLKKRLRAGAKLIVIDPRRIDLVKSAHIEAAHHLPCAPAPTWPWSPALAHVIVTEKLFDEAFIRERCDWDEFEEYAEFVSDVRHSPEMTEMLTGVPAEELRAAARLYATGRQRRDLLRARRDGAQPGLHHRHGDRQPRHADRAISGATAWG